MTINNNNSDHVFSSVIALTQRSIKMTYFENLTKTIINENKFALNYGCGKSWDNKKIKTIKSRTPRGKAFIRMEKLDRSGWWSDIKQDLFK